MTYKAMKRRALGRALARAGCTLTSQNGGHDKWTCPCGAHTFPMPRHTTISPGVVHAADRLLPCLPKGWLS